VSVRNSVRLPLEALTPYLFTIPEAGQLLDLTTLFTRQQPIELEVGFGKGAFLVEIGPAHPERNYLGIEIDKGLQLYVANRIAKRKWPNVKVASGDAGRLLAQHLSTDSLAAIHVYFPDPWWKKKHRRRRVFNESFALHAARVIQPGGFLYLATDVAEYYQVMLTILAAQPKLVPVHIGREEQVEDPSQPSTNFEKKARREGRPVWRATFQKK
jgi:tRNA (guanine-N7-)-methyltransferase